MKTLSALIIGVALLVLPAFADAEDCNTREAALRVARDAVAEREEWPNGGDFKVSSDAAGWRVTAWRVDYPKHEGSARYAGGGFRVLHIDMDGTLRKYSRE